jgi:hypothetical protein
MQIIALAGLAQCGKTTLSDEISRIAFENKMTPKRLSFAGALKRAAAEVGAPKDTQPDLYRRVCQDLGKNMRDPSYVPGVTNPNWWVDLTKRELEALARKDRELHTTGLRGETVVIFDDVRFMNELSMLKGMGATAIYIDRGTELPDPNAPFRGHESEAMAYDMQRDEELRRQHFQWTVNSTGSMEEYKIRVRPFIPVWLGIEPMALPHFEENR